MLVAYAECAILTSDITLALPARTTRPVSTSPARETVQNSSAVDLPSLVSIMYTLMFHNIASNGFVFRLPPEAPRGSSPPPAEVATGRNATMLTTSFRERYRPRRRLTLDAPPRAWKRHSAGDGARG